MFRVTKEFTFEAAHRLTQVPKDHKCARVHGHSYRVEIDVESKQLDTRGMVIEYGELDAIVKPLIGRMDHEWLGGGTLIVDGISLHPILHFETTAENIADHIGRYTQSMLNDLPSALFVSEVRLYETRTTCATWRPI